MLIISSNICYLLVKHLQYQLIYIFFYGNVHTCIGASYLHIQYQHLTIMYAPSHIIGFIQFLNSQYLANNYINYLRFLVLVPLLVCFI